MAIRLGVYEVASYYTDFNDYSVGSVVGWTSRWTSRTYEIVADAGATGGKVLRAKSPGSNQRSLISWDEIDADALRADFDVTIRSRSSSNTTSGAGSFCGIIGRGSAVGTNTGYVSTSTGSLLAQGHTLAKYVSGTATFPTPFSQSWDANVFYFQRFRLVGTSRKAKRWAGALGDEPTDWQIENADSDISAAGWVGFFSFAGADSTNHDLDTISVLTGDDLGSIVQTRRRRDLGGFGL